MWLKFKWDMFITSFIPLWMSILIVDIWKIVCVTKLKWTSGTFIWKNVKKCAMANLIPLISIIIVLLVVIISIIGINSFIKKMNKSNNCSKGKILKARKANKLSSEFLLAYILPMIAFDFCKLQSLVLFLVYFVVLAFLCIRNDNIYTNIMLEFRGYKIYTCDIECLIANDKTHVYYDSLIISQKDLTLEESNDIIYWDFNNYIYITKKEG